MTEVELRQDLAREATRRRDWATAYDVLLELRRTDGLDTDGLGALGDAAWWLGLIRETLAIAEECHDRLLEEGQVGRAAMVAIENGFNWFLRGEPDVGIGWLSRGRRLLEGQPLCLGHGFLLWIDAQERFGAGDVEGAVVGARELQQLARNLAEPVLACFGLALEGVIEIRQGRTERGFELLDEAMLPVLAGRIPPDSAGNLYCQMMSVCTDLADIERARRWTQVTERWCESFTSAVMFVGICRVHRTQLLRVQGELAAALEQARAASLELAELNVEAVAEAHYEMGETHRLRGEVVAARQAYEAADALGRIPQPGSALLLLAEGRVDESDVSIRRALAEQQDPFRRARLLVAQVEIACTRNDHKSAGTAATALEEVADTYRSPGFRAWAAMARGTVLLECGTPADAVDPLRAALTGFQRMGARYDVAMARARLGQAFLAMGDQSSAATQHSAAQEAFLTMGAHPRVVWVANMAPAKVPVSPLPKGLTAREMEILGSVAEGLSNREVAARLVISEKTVARHLANVFVKLDVSSRTAAAAWVHEHRPRA